MKIGKISRLLSAFNPVTQSATQQSSAQQSEANQNRDAVRLTSSLASNPPPKTEDEVRRAKVAAIRKQVDSGTYRVDKDKVAEALARDLLA